MLLPLRRRPRASREKVEFRRAKIRIESLEERWVPAPLQIAGQGLWQIGANFNPIPFADVQVLQDTTVGTKTTTAVVGVTQTDINGRYSTTIDVKAPAKGKATLKVAVLSQTDDVTVGPRPGDTYVANSAPAPLTKATLKGKSLNFTVQAGETGVGGAFSVLSAMVQASTYGRYLAGKPLQPVVVAIDPKEEGAYTLQSGQIFVNPSEVYDWDVLQHEYGHFYEDRVGFGHVNDGPDHSFQVHILGDVTAAFSEGFADVFPVAVQAKVRGVPYAANVPFVGDAKYQDYIDRARGTFFSYDFTKQVGVGEDDETSTAGFLFHLMAGDQGIKITDKELSDIFRARKVTTLGQAWNALAAGRTVQDRLKISKLLAAQNVAPAVNEPADNTATLLPPTLVWTKNGAAAPDLKRRMSYTLDTFAVSFYSTDYKLIRTLQVPDAKVGTGSTVRFTPSDADWQSIIAGRDKVLWVVEGQHRKVAPVTPGGALAYWSQARTISKTSLVLTQTFKQFLIAGFVQPAKTGSYDGYLATFKAAAGTDPLQFRGSIDWGDGTRSDTLTVLPSWIGPTTYALLNTHAYPSRGSQSTANSYTITITVYLASAPNQKVTTSIVANVRNTG